MEKIIMFVKSIYSYIDFINSEINKHKNLNGKLN